MTKYGCSRPSFDRRPTPKIAPKRRTLCLGLIGALLCPGTAFGATVRPGVNLGAGTVTYQAPTPPLTVASPRIDPSPSYHP